MNSTLGNFVGHVGHEELIVTKEKLVRTWLRGPRTRCRLCYTVAYSYGVYAGYGTYIVGNTVHTFDTAHIS